MGKKKRRGKSQKPRPCGGCRVCCHTLEIGALNKPKWSNCQHACLAGCGIYSQRPQECSDFQCLWSTRELPSNMRPDVAGMMAYYVDSQWGRAILLVETKPGSFETNPKARSAVESHALRLGSPIIIAPKGEQPQVMLP